MSVKLHLGCGDRILAGWVNIDIAVPPILKDPSSVGGLFRQADATQLPYPDTSVDVIYSEDLIEHLDQQEQFWFLAECYRVLRFGSCCRITCPELSYSLRSSDFLRGREGVEDAWHWGHKLVPTRAYLEEVAEMVGFVVHFNRYNDSSCPLAPKDIRPNPPRPRSGNIFADLVKSTSLPEDQ